MKLILIASLLALGGCAGFTDTNGYYYSSQEDYMAARLAEGAVLCRESAWHGYPASTFTTNTKQACRSVGGTPK